MLYRFDAHQHLLPTRSGAWVRCDRRHGHDRDAGVAQPRRVAGRNPYARLHLAQLRLEAGGGLLPGTRQVKTTWPPERLTGGLQIEHAGEPVGPPAILARGPRDQVPRAGLEHEAERIELTLRRATPAFVVEAQAAPAPHRIGHLAQEPGRVLRAIPVHRVDVQAFTHARSLPSAWRE